MPTVIKNALRALIFVLGLVLMLFLLSKAFSPAEGTIADGVHSIESNGIYAEAENSIDVIFLGDSVVYSGISPLQIWSEYGIPTYCCSTSAQKLWYTEDMLRKAFSCQSPKLVMMEADALFSKFNFDDSAMHKAEGVLPIFKYHDRWKQLARQATGDKSNERTAEDYKGYRLNFKNKPAANTGYMKQKLKIETLPSRNRSYFKKIKDYCEEHGARLVLFSCPNTKHWNNARHKEIAKLADEYGLDFIDLNTLTKDVSIDWSRDTRDGGDHLNYYGAAKATAYLGKYLNSLGSFADRRRDPEYQSWNDDAEGFLEIIAKKTK